MFHQKSSLALLSLLALFSCSLFSTAIASVTIGAMTFDSAVVNDNAWIASPANYSCIQSGGTITLSGQQPIPSSNVTYFYNNESKGSEREFMVGIDYTELTDTNSLAGIMFFSGQFTTSSLYQQWYRIGVTGNRRVYLESHTAGYGASDKKTLLCTLLVTATTAYLHAKIEGGFLEFSISYTPIIDSLSLLRLGLPIYYPYEHNFGFFIEPHVTGSYETAVFNSITIIPREPSNGVQSLFEYAIPFVGGLTDWASKIKLPPNFFDTPMKLVQDLRNAYINGGDAFVDPRQSTIFSNMLNMKTGSPLETISGTENERIEKSIRNARIYLADILDSLITGNTRKYPCGGTPLNLAFDFSLNTLLQQGIDLVKSCHAATDVKWYNFLNPFEPFIRTYNIANCATDVLSILTKVPTIKEVIPKKDDILLEAAQYIMLLTLMALLDQDFYNSYYTCLSGYFKEVYNYTQKIAPLYLYNNIPMKVFSAIALWDLAHGATASSATLNLWLKDKFMDGGSYAEGSEYLVYLNEELLPYYLISSYNGWLPEKLQLNSVKNSGY